MENHNKFKEALTNKDVETCKQMIKDGFSIDDNDDYGLIDDMIHYMDFETIQQFIDIGLSVTNIMLITAASWGNLDLMRLFMKHGATITEYDDDGSCDDLIDSLGECNRAKIIEFMIEEKLYLPFDKCDMMATGIHCKSQVVIDYVLSLPEGIEVANQNLENVIEEDNLDLLKLFVSKGIDIHYDNDICIRHSILYENLEFLEYLLNNFTFPKELLQELYTSSKSEKIKEFIKPFI